MKVADNINTDDITDDSIKVYDYLSQLVVDPKTGTSEKRPS
jgi:hypothetical protein